MDAAAIDRTLFEQVPFSHHVGAHVTSVSAESAEAVLPDWTGTPEPRGHGSRGGAVWPGRGGVRRVGAWGI